HVSEVEASQTELQIVIAHDQEERERPGEHCSPEGKHPGVIADDRHDTRIGHRARAGSRGAQGQTAARDSRSAIPTVTAAAPSAATVANGLGSPVPGDTNI